MTPLPPAHPRRQSGTSLVEVLVGLLVLSLGLLSAGGMLAYSVQMPRLAGYRATAMQLAASHIERMRANPEGAAAGLYDAPLNYDGSLAELTATPCPWPACDAHALARMDTSTAQHAIREQLPAGALQAQCTPAPCGPGAFGDVWVVWREPQTFAAFQAEGADLCPPALASTKSPAPRCVHLRFSL